MNVDLTYSAWHRKLGFGFFAMDVDSIEIRNSKPVAVIETSLCTEWYKCCNGSNGVFNRFLKETGGFQIELAWWVARWLDVPAFVVCLGDPDQAVHILSLINSVSIKISESEYLELLENLGTDTPSHHEIALIKNPLELPDLLESLKNNYSGISAYPYFSNHQKWLVDYKKRIKEVNNKIPRTRTTDAKFPNNIQVKKETTHSRRQDYLDLRRKAGLDFFNLHWVEWRKDSYRELIGRPVALIRTSLIDNSSKEHLMEVIFLERKFKSENEFIWWNECANRMKIPFYSVYYSPCGMESGNEAFIVFEYPENGRSPRCLSMEEYTKFICSL